MGSQLQGTRALVTGAASGMGRAIAQAFAREGAHVAVHARSIERARETLDGISAAGGNAFAVAADLADTAQIRRMCGEALERLGGIDCIVNNAGVADTASVIEMEEPFWDRVLSVNLKAPFLVCKHTLPRMLEQGRGGTVIFIASTNGKTADAGWSAYNSSKHGLLGLMRCLAAEVGRQQVRVNAICPGWIETKMAVALHEKMAREAQRSFEAVYDESMRFNMMKALIPAEDVAEMALFLASDRGRYITGQSINVDAGLCYW